MPNFEIQVDNDATVDANGDIMFQYTDGRRGDDQELTFSIDQLEAILKTAKRHKAAYQAFKDTDWEDESAYDKIFYDE